VWRSLVSRLVWDQEISQVQILSPRPVTGTSKSAGFLFIFAEKRNKPVPKVEKNAPICNYKFLGKLPRKAKHFAHF
jgi:hypothetical protein